MKALPVSDNVLNEVANLLSADFSTLKARRPQFSASSEACNGCGEHLNFYSFVKTALDMGAHGKNYMAKFLLSQEPVSKEIDTNINCASCGKTNSVKAAYAYGDVPM
jgi:hypothetical protein